MSWTDDERGRVPFGVIGVVLLLSTTTLITGVSPQPSQPTQPVDDAVRVGTANARAVATHAARTAARRAAANPVSTPADTPYGTVLNRSDPFRDALRVRVYLAVASAFNETVSRSGDGEVRFAVPAPSTPRELRAAKRSVRIAPVANGTAFRLTLTNVTMTVTRDGQTIVRERRLLSVPVGSPVLAMHRQATAYEARLNRGPLDGPGLGRSTTTRLYAIAWARGFAQYGGAPISNVVGARHVTFATNGGILATQRAVFGETTDASQSAYRRQTRCAAKRDLVSATGLPADAGEGVLDARTNISLEESADLALAETLRSDRLDRAIDSVYSAEVRLLARVESGDATRPAPVAPGPNWTLVASTSDRDVTVSTGSAPLPAPPPGTHRLETIARHVTERYRVTWTWRRGLERRETTATWTDTARVGLAVVGRHAPSDIVPDNAVKSVHRSGGPLDGPNLVGIESAAVHRFVTSQGGPDTLARRAVTGTLPDRSVTISGNRPTGLRRWITRDLLQLRQSVAEHSVNASSLDVATGRTNPAARTVDALKARRDALAGTTGPYGSVAEKARTAARMVYLNAVIERAGERSESVSDATTVLERAVSRAGGDVAVRPKCGTTDTPVSRDRVTVSTDPAVFGLSDPRLATRNVNVFTVPTGDVVDEVIGTESRVGLGTAGRSLRAANRTLSENSTTALNRNRDRLTAETHRATTAVRRDLAAELAHSTTLEPTDVNAILDAHAAENGSLADTALALSNGSAIPRVVAAVPPHTVTDAPPSMPPDDWLSLRLRLALASSLRSSDASVPAALVNETDTETKRVLRETLKAATSKATAAAWRRLQRQRFGRILTAVPAGLPVAPVPGYWYLTANAWVVQVDGRYDSVVVHSAQGVPGAGTIEYVREPGPVAIDVDGDDEPERIGHTDPVTFSMTTTVVVVVPPGQTGVGDVDGQLDERSPGWRARPE